MARKNRNLAGFGDVANPNVNKSDNINNNVNINDDVNKNKNEDPNTSPNANLNESVNANANESNSVNENINKNINENDNDNINIKDEFNQNANTTTNNNANVNVPTNDDDNEGSTKPKLDYLDTLIEGNTRKSSDNGTVLTGIYLQKDLSQILDRLAKKGGRGAKSRIVNEALRSVFMDKGLL